MPESLKHKTVKGVRWSSVERFSVQGVQFLVMLVIARLLSPDDFGFVGMLTIFLAVAQSLIDSGFSQALIRKQDRTDVDNSTVFYFNIVVSLLLYVILYVSAPCVANFYNEPQLCKLMCVCCALLSSLIRWLSFREQCTWPPSILRHKQRLRSPRLCCLEELAFIWQ